MPNSNWQVWLFLSILTFLLQNFVSRLCKDSETVSVKVSNIYTVFLPLSFL